MGEKDRWEEGGTRGTLSEEMRDLDQLRRMRGRGLYGIDDKGEFSGNRQKREEKVSSIEGTCPPFPNLREGKTARGWRERGGAEMVKEVFLRPERRSPLSPISGGAMPINILTPKGGTGKRGWFEKGEDARATSLRGRELIWKKCDLFLAREVLQSLDHRRRRRGRGRGGGGVEEGKLLRVSVGNQRGGYREREGGAFSCFCNGYCTSIPHVSLGRGRKGPF